MNPNICNLHSYDYHKHGDLKQKQFKFEPPLYVQRYDYLSNILNKYHCTTYVDIGCSECRLVSFLKNTNTVLNLIIGVDIDQVLLENAQYNLWVDYVQNRNHPLEVYLIKGDISKPSNYFISQACSRSTDLDCVSLIEVIEHMDPETLSKTVETVFNKLNPKLIIISTPNYEFNVVFEDLNNHKTESTLQRKYRHPDHKFEWTRKEFQDWCVHLIKFYTDYQIVRLDGLGCPPDHRVNVGFCSQVAVFKRIDTVQQTYPNRFQAHLNRKILNRNNKREQQESPYFNGDIFKNETLENGQKFELVSYIEYSSVNKKE